MEIFKAIDSETLELIVFMALPIVIYVSFVITTFSSSESSIINSENSHWVRIAKAKRSGTNAQEICNIAPSEEEEGPSPIRIEMLSNGMMVQRGGKPRKLSRSAA